jgi:hypothetical protein
MEAITSKQILINIKIMFKLNYTKLTSPLYVRETDSYEHRNKRNKSGFLSLLDMLALTVSQRTKYIKHTKIALGPIK